MYDFTDGYVLPGQKQYGNLTGGEMLYKYPVTSLEFMYGFLKGSEFVPGGQKLDVCKTTMEYKFIRPGFYIGELVMMMSIPNTFQLLYQSYSMMYYSDYLVRSCTNAAL